MTELNIGHLNKSIIRYRNILDSGLVLVRQKSRKQIYGGNGMKEINFEEAKAKCSKVKSVPAKGSSKVKMQKQYRNDAEFYNQWYYDHVVGQDKDGNWIYKDL